MSGSPDGAARSKLLRPPACGHAARMGRLRDELWQRIGRAASTAAVADELLLFGGIERLRAEHAEACGACRGGGRP